MATRSELETECHKYEYHLEKARQAEQEGRWGHIVDNAKSAWQHIDGMMQYRRKYESREFDSIEAIDLVVQYAPLRFDYKSLDELDQLMKEYKRIEKNTLSDMRQKLIEASSLMDYAYDLWHCLISAEEQRQLSLDELQSKQPDRWNFVIHHWIRMGVVVGAEPASTKIELTTSISRRTRAKCSSCGALVQAVTHKFYEEQACPKCKVNGWFVILN